jgi:hypothetical protein
MAMRASALVLVGLFWMGTLGAPAEAAFVQLHEDFGTAVPSIQYTVPDVGAGHLLVVAIKLSIGGGTTVTSPGLVWTKDITAAQAALGWVVDVWSAPNVPGGDTTITVSSTGGATAIRVLTHEYSDMATTAPAHRTSSASGTSASPDAGSVTTTLANCTLFLVTGTDSDLLGWTAGPDYTMRPDCNAGAEPSQKICSEDHGPVAAGTYSGTFTINSDSWVAVLVAYAPGGDTAPPAAPTGLTVR